MYTLKMYENEEYCQLGDVDLPDLFCPIDEVAKISDLPARPRSRMPTEASR